MIYNAFRTAKKCRQTMNFLEILEALLSRSSTHKRQCFRQKNTRRSSYFLIRGLLVRVQQEALTRALRQKDLRLSSHVSHSSAAPTECVLYDRFVYFPCRFCATEIQSVQLSCHFKANSASVQDSFYWLLV